jgi:hypothetical protein
MNLTIDQRLRQLLLMLSSDHDGEIINATRAIGRMLKAAGHDWHQLVQGLLGSSVHAEARADEINSLRQQLERAEKVITEQRRELTKLRAEPRHEEAPRDWREMHEYCKAKTLYLRQREREFISSLGAWTRLTPKQHEWLTAIFLRLGGKL